MGNHIPGSVENVFTNDHSPITHTNPYTAHMNTYLFATHTLPGTLARYYIHTIHVHMNTYTVTHTHITWNMG